MQFSFTLQTISDAVFFALKAAGNRKVWAIHGDMGAGKTTFVNALCEHLAVTDTVGSPTYSIINEYQTADGNTVYHMDWYRLMDEEEALQAGVEDFINSNNLCLIEWPEKAPGLLPDHTFNIKIAMKPDETRTIETN